MTRVTFQEAISGVGCSLEVPAGFSTDDTLVNGLGYPWELGAVRNAAIPGGLDTYGSGFPQVGELSARGAVLWLIVGDKDYDAYQESLAHGDRQGDPLPYAVRKVSGARLVAAGPPLRPAEAVSNRWENIRSWWRNIPLDETKYCDVWVFAGTSQFAPVGEMAGVVGSIELRV